MYFESDLISAPIFSKPLKWKSIGLEPISQPPEFAHIHPVEVLLIGLFCSGASVLGDMTVSMLKRESGCKDAGSWLPGHGGLMDRLDSICGAAPFFALALILVGYV